MIDHICTKLKALADDLDKPLYIVGGAVRGFIIEGKISNDIDLAGPMTTGELISALKKHGFIVRAEYPRTHTVMFSLKEDNSTKYEFTSFRKEIYGEGGGHTPVSTELTEDIYEDALRRDFRCNAVYYDLKSNKFVDPLNGIEDIKNKILNTVKNPGEVFSSDGLRLLRLFRFAGELGFTPTEEVITYAKKFSGNVVDISGERIYEELTKMLICDQKYSYSDKEGHYRAFKYCHETGVLKYIFPELALGEGLSQRKDFHQHDVLEHSFKALLYSHPSVRLAALLHDIGKSVVYLRNGSHHFHSEEGANIVRKRLLDLKAPRHVLDDTLWLILNHMYDLKANEPIKNVRRFIVDNYPKIERLLLLKEADIKASNSDLVPLTVVRWREIIKTMQTTNSPFGLKDLKINGKDLNELGLKGRIVGDILDKILDIVLENPLLNERRKLISLVEKLSWDMYRK